jgi:hypothetical protein
MLAAPQASTTGGRPGSAARAASVNFAPLAEQPRHHRYHTEQRPRGEESEQHDHQGGLPAAVEVEIERDRRDILGREREQKQKNDQPERPGDDTHTRFLLPGPGAADSAVAPTTTRY